VENYSEWNDILYLRTYLMFFVFFQDIFFHSIPFITIVWGLRGYFSRTCGTPTTCMVAGCRSAAGAGSLRIRSGDRRSS